MWEKVPWELFWQRNWGIRFIDADLMIQKREKRLLKEIIAQEGVDGFIQIENR